MFLFYITLWQIKLVLFRRERKTHRKCCCGWVFLEFYCEVECLVHQKCKYINDLMLLATKHLFNIPFANVFNHVLCTSCFILKLFILVARVLSFTSWVYFWLPFTCVSLPALPLMVLPTCVPLPWCFNSLCLWQSLLVCCFRLKFVCWSSCRVYCFICS